MHRLGWLEQVRKEKTAGVTATRAKTIFYSYSCLLHNRMTIFALQSEMELRKRGEVVALSRERVGEGAKCLTVAIRTSLKETSVSCVGGLGKPRQW